MTRYQISFITDSNLEKFVEVVVRIVYKNHGKILDYLRTTNVCLMLVSIDNDTMTEIKAKGIEIELPPKIVLS